ncbi:hypothetical protein HDU97_008978 [Phlyctochytrium planicorne]|nr:hypothetical protein HDU97_008978 [Phlyctochytrium planicorne]
MAMHLLQTRLSDAKWNLPSFDATAKGRFDYSNSSGSGLDSHFLAIDIIKAFLECSAVDVSDGICGYPKNEKTQELFREKLSVQIMSLTGVRPFIAFKESGDGGRKYIMHYSCG